MLALKIDAKGPLNLEGLGEVFGPTCRHEYLFRPETTTEEPSTTTTATATTNNSTNATTDDSQRRIHRGRQSMKKGNDSVLGCLKMELVLR